MRKIISYVAAVLIMTACQQVVDLKLSNTNAQLVIEGSVNNGQGPYQVTITKSVDFYHDNTYPAVSGAMVIITDSTAAVTDSLSETAQGVYQTHFIGGHPGHTYKLKAIIAGKTYTSTSTMPQPVQLDSVTFDYATKKIIRATANFQDPAGVVNFYKFTSYVNGEYLREVHTWDDRLSDGRYIREKMDNDTSDIKKGNQVLLNLVGIDKAVYTYMKQAEDIAYNNSNLVTPTTPQSNIVGGALGYFSAETINSKTNIPTKAASTQ
jgi:hypothetical protein